MFQIIGTADAVKTETLTCLEYGEPGIGKTSLAFTTENPLLLDFDKGLQRACYRGTAVRVNRWEDVIELQKSDDLKKLAPKTIICDTVGTMLDNYIADYVKRDDPKNMRRGGELALSGYGAMKNIFQQFLDWATSLGINVIFIAHVTEERDGDNVKYIPKVTGGSYDILRQTMDLIGYMESKKDRRVIDFTPRDRHIGKDCAGIGLLEIPNASDPAFKTFMGDLIATTLDHMNRLTEDQTAAINKLAEFEKLLIGIDVDKCNGELLDAVGKETDKGIQKQIWVLLKKAAKKVGIQYDQKENYFFIPQESTAK